MSTKFDEDAHSGLLFSLYHVHKLIFLYVPCDLDLFTSEINRVQPLNIVNMSAKFDEEAHDDGLVSIVLIRSKLDAQTNRTTTSL